MPGRVITFDCYGTLIDWERGIGDAFAAAGWGGGREALLREYHAQEAEVELAAYRPYREVLAETARRVASRLGFDAGDGSFLPRSLPDWPPFPDTNGALERLAASGAALAILSNVDDELLAATRRHFPVGFEFVITAQQVRAYKPAHAHFLAARERVAGRDWIHAAQSWYHDVVPAKKLGIPTAWVNRKGEERTGEVVPDHEVPNVAALADLIGSDGLSS